MKLCINIYADTGFQFNGDAVLPDGYLLDPGFWNAIARVMGRYSGNMSADTLTVGCKDTMDERIMKALSEKDTTQAALIDAVKADLKI